MNTAPEAKSSARNMKNVTVIQLTEVCKTVDQILGAKSILPVV